MRRFCVYFFVSGLILGSLLLQYDPASATLPNDTMAHFGSGSSCSNHMVDLTHVKTTSYTYKLCVGHSHADSWSAEIRNDYTGNLVTGCSLSQVSPSTTSSFSCSITSPGFYRGIVTYWVSGSPFTHIDRRYVSP